MKIKRFFAPNIRQAISEVREQLGPDAVILSNRRARDGVEIVAAVDYDASLFKSAGGTSGKEGEARPSPDQTSVPRAPASATREPKPANAIKVETDTHRSMQAQLSRTEARPSSAYPPEITWSQDPMLTEMRSEIKTLRSLLEQQLCGLAWNNMVRHQPQRAELLRCLMEFGLSPKHCQELAESVADEPDLEHAWYRVLGLLSEQVSVTDDDILTHGGIVALVGPTGVGKTTTTAKLAARFILRHGPRRVALVTIDSYRIGAHDQLRTYGRILDVPVRTAGDEKEFRLALQGLEDKALVLVDTTGMGQRDLRLSQQLAMIDMPQVKTYLVLSATTQGPALEDIVCAFAGIKPAGCIVTKVDETLRLGGLLSVAIKHRLPLAYISDGQRVPEDLHPARAKDVINKAIALMQKADIKFGDEILALALGGMVAHASL
jgi:flagellar biosynthesis protein FlhF